MTLLVFDIGGQSVKHAIWDNNELIKKSNFKTPENWDELKRKMSKVVDIAKSTHEILGVGISSPGSVDSDEGIIRGISSVPYIHGFKIIEELQELFDLPVTIENDANCAALAELGYGVAKEYDSVAFMIIGSGIGGAIAINGSLIKGKHLFAGEVGYMLLEKDSTLSNLASSLHQIERHNKTMPTNEIKNGLELFNLADQGYEEAIVIVDEIYDALARGIYNLSLVIDPQLIAIGGGISIREEIVEELMLRSTEYLKQQGASDIKPNIKVCKYFNDSNLIGAAVNFELK